MINPSHSINIIHKLTQWYNDHHTLFPWRKMATPYATWISEIMLQQTTVTSVIPYFEAFMQRFPTVQHLACSHIDAVLALWQGLGYYRRAHYLHKAAQHICDQHDGVMPKSLKEIGDLPGVGPYTQAAIASIAYNIPVVPVDGNVYRVMARLFCLPFSKQNLKKPVIPYIQNFEDALSHIMQKEPQKSHLYPGAFAQGLMDLGRTVCTPKSPKCTLCPLQSVCGAYAYNDAVSYPRPSIKSAIPIHYAATWIMIQNDHIFLEKRPNSGLLGGLWQCPTTPFLKEPIDLDVSHTHDNCSHVGDVTHIFSHFKLLMHVYDHPRDTPPQSLSKKPGIWIPLDDLKSYGLSTLMKKSLKISKPYQQWVNKNQRLPALNGSR